MVWGYQTRDESKERRDVNEDEYAIERCELMVLL